MKVLETKNTITVCPCCKTKLEIEPKDISPLSVAATAVGFRGSFVCPVCKYEAYLIRNSDKCV